MIEKTTKTKNTNSNVNNDAKIQDSNNTKESTILSNFREKERI